MLKTKVNVGRFSLPIAVIIATSLIVGGLFKLGLWQLSRADEKVALAVRIKVQQQQVVLVNQSKVSKAQAHMPATMQGSYDSSHQFIYDNVTHKGVAGFEVITPFKLQDSEQVILVNRGWKPLKDRRLLRQTLITIAENQRQVKGVLREVITRYALGDSPVETTFPIVLQRLDLASLGKRLGYPLLPMILELDPNEKDGFVRAWKPFQGSADKHTAYAIQWFAFAGIFLIGTLLLYRKK